MTNTKTIISNDFIRVWVNAEGDFVATLNDGSEHDFSDCSGGLFEGCTDDDLKIFIDVETHGDLKKAFENDSAVKALERYCDIAIEQADDMLMFSLARPSNALPFDSDVASELREDYDLDNDDLKKLARDGYCDSMSFQGTYDSPRDYAEYVMSELYPDVPMLHLNVEVMLRDLNYEGLTAFVRDGNCTLVFTIH